MSRALVVLVVGACAGCTLLVSTGGLSGEVVGLDADAGDAGPEASDGASPGEASREGGSPLDCSEPGVVLCDDFERTTGLGPWSERSTSSDGAVDTTTRDAKSGERSLRATLQAKSDAGEASLRLDTGKTATKRILYRFAFRALGRPSDGNVGQVNTVAIVDGDGYTNVYVHVTEGGVFLAEQSFPKGGGSKFYQYPIPAIVQGGTWRSVAVEIFIGTPARLRVTVDGAESLSRASQLAIPSGRVVVHAGIGYAGAPHPEGEVLLDDCVLVVE